MEKHVFAVIGSDARGLYLARYLSRCGYEARMSCFDLARFGQLHGCERIAFYEAPEQAVKNADIVILPTPTLVRGLLNAPYAQAQYQIKEIIDWCREADFIFGGMFPADMKQLLTHAHAKKDVQLIDILKKDEFQIRNAIPSTEGAIQVAMEHLPGTLCGTRGAVIGFGRIGKLLAIRLKALGVHVDVIAARADDPAWCEALDIPFVALDKLDGVMGEYELVYNTIPALTLTEPVLKLAHPDLLLIDLASAPGGADAEAVKQLGISFIHALSLPGKVAPRSAGESIGKTVLSLI